MNAAPSIPAHDYLSDLQGLKSLNPTYLVGFKPGFLTTQEDITAAQKSIFTIINRYGHIDTDTFSQTFVTNHQKQLKNLNQNDEFLKKRRNHIKMQTKGVIDMFLHDLRGNVCTFSGLFEQQRLKLQKAKKSYRETYDVLSKIANDQEALNTIRKYNPDLEQQILDLTKTRTGTPACDNLQRLSRVLSRNKPFITCLNAGHMTEEEEEEEEKKEEKKDSPSVGRSRSASSSAYSHDALEPGALEAALPSPRKERTDNN